MTKPRLSRTERVAEMLAIAVASLLAIGLMVSSRDDPTQRRESSQDSSSAMDGEIAAPSAEQQDGGPEDSTERRPGPTGADEGHENHGAIYGGP